MSGNRWTFNPPIDLTTLLEDLGARLLDWSPVMQQIAVDMESFVEDVVIPTSGQGKWKDMAPSTVERWGSHPLLQLSGHTSRPYQSGGGLRFLTGRDWSKVNAAVLNVAPHAHLMEGGVTRRSVSLYQAGGKRKSRASVRKKIADGEAGGAMHSPPREFIYIDERRGDELYPNWILDYFYGELAG